MPSTNLEDTHQGPDLTSIARKTDEVIKTVSRTSTNAARLSTNALMGCLGFGVGSMMAFVSLALTSTIIYAPFCIPIAGMCGLLIGILCGRDHADRANSRTVALIEQVWVLRDLESAALLKRMRLIVDNNPAQIRAIETKLNFLEIAAPLELMRYYGLSDSIFRRAIESASSENNIDTNKHIY